MKSPRKTPGLIRFCAVLLAAALVPPAALPAQDPPPAPVPKVDPPQAPRAGDAQAGQTPQAPRTQAPSDNPGTLRVAVNLVILPVTVKDGDGRLVADLTRNDFRILDDNIEQRLEYFSAEAFPLSVVILVDNDLKSKDSEQVESSLSAIVGGLSGSVKG